MSGYTNSTTWPKTLSRDCHAQDFIAINEETLHALASRQHRAANDREARAWWAWWVTMILELPDGPCPRLSARPLLSAYFGCGFTRDPRSRPATSCSGVRPHGSTSGVDGHFWTLTRVGQFLLRGVESSEISPSGLFISACKLEHKMTEGLSEITTLDSKVVYENRWMKVREDAIQRQDGSVGIYGVVEKSDFAVIVPVEDNGSIHLVEQYRYPVGGRFWEFPQGSWEQTPAADPLEVARGELPEETGLDAAKMTYAGHLFQGYGYATQGYHIFLAQTLRRGELALDHEEQGLVTRLFSPTAVVSMIQAGEIKDATTVAALGLLRINGLLRPHF
jgi:ADP-ribose pyrophosphatase